MYNGDDHEERFLDYDQFSSLLLNIVTAGGLNFHDMANSITLSICKNDSHQMDLSGLFHNDDTHRSTLATDSSNPSLDHDDIFDTLQYARMSRLFDLWDTDHSGDLDFEEIVLGFSKCFSLMRFSNRIQKPQSNPSAPLRKVPRGEINRSDC